MSQRLQRHFIRENKQMENNHEEMLYNMSSRKCTFKWVIVIYYQNDQNPEHVLVKI